MPYAIGMQVRITADAYHDGIDRRETGRVTGYVLYAVDANDPRPRDFDNGYLVTLDETTVLPSGIAVRSVVLPADWLAPVFAKATACEACFDAPAVARGLCSECLSAWNADHDTEAALGR